MSASRETRDADGVAADAKSIRIGPQEADGCLAVLNRCRKFRFATEPVADRCGDVTFRCEGLGKQRHVAALPLEPTATVNANDGGQSCGSAFRTIKIELHLPLTVAGVNERGMRL